MGEKVVDTIIVLMFSGVIVVGLMLIAIMTTGRGGKKALNKEHYRKEWEKIERSVTNDPSSQQFAILQADKLVDHALRERGYRGETMADRMKSAQQQFTRLDALWAAHKLRNRIAHETNFTISESLTQKALASFNKALKDLGAL